MIRTWLSSFIKKNKTKILNLLKGLGLIILISAAAGILFSQMLKNEAEMTENNKIYLIILHDSKFKDSRSPLSIERENIRNLIINRRKIALINKEEQELINEARNQNKIEVYHQ